MKKLLLFIFIVLPTFIFAQGEAANWYFGNFAGLQFDPNTGTVAAVTDGRTETLEGCATISDPNGVLLFYTDGRTVWDRNHVIMPNGDYFGVTGNMTGLFGDPSSTSSALIVPNPQDPNIYYIFTVDEPHHGNVAGPNEQVFPLDQDDNQNNGLNFSVVDISVIGANGSIGDVIERNNPLLTYDVTNPQEVNYKCSEKITAVKSSDCESFWLLTHFTDKFYAFKVEATGVDTNPVISNVPTEVPVSGYRRNALGYLKASPQGDKLAVAHLGLTTVEGGNGPGKIMLYDFDNSTGIVSNELELYDGDAPYGVEFSPEATKLYATVGLGNNGSETVYYYNTTY